MRPLLIPSLILRPRWTRVLTGVLAFLLTATAGSEPAAALAARDTLDTGKARAQTFFVRGMTQAYLNDYRRAITLYERALELAPNEAPILSAMADAQATQDEVSTALFYAEQARNAAPHNAYYYEQLARLHQQAGQTDQAIAVYRELVERFPDMVDARLALAKMLSEAHQAAEAVAIYEELERQMDGATPRLYMEMLHLYRRLNDDEGVGRVLRALVKLRPEETLFTHLLGQYYMKEGQIDDAIQLYEEILSTQPEDVEIVLQLTEMYREQGRTAAADSLLNRLTETDGASAAQLVRRARLLYRHSRWQDAASVPEAARLLEQALELDPEHEEALQMLGELRYQNGQYAEAGRMLERALDQNPRAPQRWAQAAAAYLRAEQTQRAVDVAEEGLLLFPGQLPLVRVAANGLLILNRNQAAIERFQELRTLLEESPEATDEQQADVLATLGLLYSRVDNLPASDRAYEQAIALAPNHATALNNYAYSLAGRALHLDHALEMAQRAVDIESDNASYLDTLGWVYFQRENYAAAEKWLEAAIETGDASATVYEHFGDVQRELGNPAAARTYWQQALDRAPGRSALRTKLNALQP